MSFVHPAGLWALAGVLALLAAHFVRRRYAQRALPSAYLWRLAERYRKQREPGRRMRRAALLVAQLFCVATAALLVAQPEIALPGARTAYVAVLDASGSMRVCDASGETRFARACRAIEADAAALPWGSRVSVVLAGDEARLAAENLRAGSKLRLALDAFACDYGAGDLDGAMAICDRLLQSGGASQVVLYTDREIAGATGLRVVYARGESEWNVSLTPVAAERTGQGMRLRATLCSAGRDADVALSVLVDGAEPDAANVALSVGGEVCSDMNVHAAAGEPVEIAVQVTGMKAASSAVLSVQAQDGLDADNEARFCGRPTESTRVLLTGGNVFFLQRALEAFDEVALECAEDCTEVAPEGYDVYVYSGCMPRALPESGSVWLLNPPDAPEDTGVVFGELLLGGAISAEAEGMLTENLALREAVAARFTEIVSCGRMTPVLRCGEMPLLLSGKTASGGALLLLACDVAETNLPLTADFIALLDNMLRLSAPQPLPAQLYACGDAPELARLSTCARLFVQSPDRSIRELDAAQSRVVLREPGVYSVMEQLAGGRERLFSFAAHMPEAEGADAGDALTLALREPNVDALAALERRVPIAGLLAALLLLLLMIEWGLDEHERV